MRISYSYGIMDLFHYGHLKALQTAARNADLHIVGLVSDEAAKNWMGTVVSNEKEREAVLKSLSCVDWVMPQKTLDPTDNLKKLHYIDLNIFYNFHLSQSCIYQIFHQICNLSHNMPLTYWLP